MIDPSDEVAIGYVDLSNFENSTLFVNDEGLAHELKAEYGFKKISIFEDFMNQTNEYAVLEHDTVSAMLKDKNFNPLPRNEKACMFCSIKNICKKEAYGNS